MIDIHWFLPTGGDSRDVLPPGPTPHQRPPDFGFLAQNAKDRTRGSHEEVADRIAEYHEVGFDEFILSGYPHLEEAYAFGEGVMPVLRARGLMPPLDRDAAPVFSFR